MAERRAELVIDLRIGKITVTGGPVKIPATVSTETAGGAGAGRPPRPGRHFYWDASQGRWLPGTRPGTAPGTPIGARVPRAPTAAAPTAAAGFAAQWSRLLPIITAVQAAVVAAVVAIAVALRIVSTGLRIVMTGLRLAWKVGETAFRALLALTKTVSGAFYQLGKVAIGATIAAIRKLVAETVGAMRKLGDLGKQFVGNATTVFAEYEQTLQNTVTVMDIYGEAAIKMRADLTSALEGITAGSRRSMTEAAGAAYDVASAGFQTLKEVADLTRGSIVLSEATLYDLKDTARILMATLLQFRLGTEHTMRAANAMAAIIAWTPADMEKLSGALRYAGTMASMFGESLEGTLANIGGLFLVGRAATQAGMEIANVYNSLVKVSKRGIQALATIGLTAEQVNPARRRLVDIISTFEEAQKKFGQARVAEVITSVFTLRAARGLMGMLAIGSEQIRKLEREITDTNTALTMQADQMRTLQGAWAQIKNLWQRVQLQFGQGLNPELTKALHLVRGFLDELLDTKGAGEFGKVVGSALEAVAGVLVRLAPAGLVVLQEGLKLLPRMVETFGRALIELTPTLWLGLDALLAFGTQLGQSLFPQLVNLAVRLAPVLLKIAETVLPPLASAFGRLMKAVGDFVSSNEGLIRNWFEMVVDLIISVMDALPLLAPLVRDLAMAFLATLPGMIAWAEKLLPQIIGAVRELLPALLNLTQAGLGEFAKVLAALLPYAIRFAEVVLPMAVQALQYITDTLINIMPVAADIGLRALDLLNLAFGGSTEGVTSLGEALYRVLAWVDSNFYVIVIAACEALNLLIDVLIIVGDLATGMAVTALPTLAMAFGLLAIPIMMATQAYWVFLRAVKLYLQYCNWVNPQQKTKDLIEDIGAAADGAAEDMTRLWRTFWKLGTSGPRAAAAIATGTKAMRGLKGPIEKFKETAEQERQRRKAGGETIPPIQPAPVRSRGWTPPAGYTLEPAGYRPGPGSRGLQPGGYTFGPIYCNSLDAMRNTWDDFYKKAKADEERSGRLRAAV